MWHRFLFYLSVAIRKIYRIFRYILTLIFRDETTKKRLEDDKDKAFFEYNIDFTGKEASIRIRETLLRDEPCMIARFGATELVNILEYLYSEHNVDNKRSWKDKIYRFVYNDRTWWYDWVYRYELMNLSGFFPITLEKCSEFARLMLENAPKVDIFGSSVRGEDKVYKYLKNAKICKLGDFEPWYQKSPWTNALEGKKILVVYPFSDTIEYQYSNHRDKLFSNKDILPRFDLIVYKSVQSIVGTKTEFDDWFQALDFMTDEIKKIDFDIAIIGCGAFGFPLAARIKDMGKKAVHMGGATQILFGIKGKRWDTEPVVSKLYNKYWTRPKNKDKPENFQLDEGGAFW